MMMHSYELHAISISAEFRTAFTKNNQKKQASSYEIDVNLV
jgi:hypothetical protein